MDAPPPVDYAPPAEMVAEPRWVAAQPEPYSAPAEPVSGGNWFVANVVGFLVGSFVGVPLGTLIGSLIHLPGQWPYYLGLIIGVSIWTAVANAIKAKMS